ncbi:phage tail protein [Defluviitalea raffinosedens]|uniref:Phage tail protein n=1 Tax=Defluviitalea raffinosedens TaxID=1450156 RepID=A0A7C8LSZ4_9FIRM|nr:phage tail sheath family protein [Defluviitalea raffinosedens]KAE9633717.1 phage tail protein [Defluviitalea raffinosedens]
MALGGGTFLVQNKVLPGAYINFVSAARASATLSDRGYAAIPIELNWGRENEVITVENADVQKNCFELFGYSYTDEEMKPLRELFKGAKTAYIYRINSGGEKATVTEGELTITAKYGGTRGNDIRVVINVNVDDESKYDVITYVGNKKVDEQTVSTAEELVDNDFVTFKGTGNLSPTAGVNLTGGTNGTIDGDSYSTFLEKIESYSFNTLGYPGKDNLIKDLFVQFTKRMRDEHGVKFQTVLYKKSDADYEGIISVENKALDDNEASLVYWLTGQEAGCAVNRSLTNKTYDGEYAIDTDYKQSALEAGLKTGKLMFHKVGDRVNVLDDINTFVSYTVDKNEDFNNNQVIRVLDQIGNDTAVLFNTKYLGKVQNNEAGRIAFWNDLVSYHNQLQTIQAIENFSADDITVEKGADKKSVVVTDYVMPVSVMAKLYMTVVVE